MTVLVQLTPPWTPEAETAHLGDLLALARSRTGDDRQRLLLAITTLCEANPPAEELSEVLGEVLLMLAHQVERDVRRILAERLAKADWAPHALVNMLALDEIEIARPILASSPMLQDDDLIVVLVQATIEHQIEVARRPSLSGRVADTIIDRAEPATLTALASNRTAEISPDGVRRLVEHSRRIAALRAPLTRHPRLTDALAEQLYQWVGTALRQAIGARFQIDDSHLDTSVQQAVDKAFGDSPLALASVESTEFEESERRLIAKLHAADQLRPSYLVRAVREKRLNLFVHGLAALGGFSVAEVRGALNAGSPEAIYYACSAVGIDRAVFVAMINEIRLLNDGAPGTYGAQVWLRGSISAASAARAFRALAHDNAVAKV
ncbi:DUF2336 domain-containing protein [uncultured Brevundimonas sp.]|uniref:DUF2336 domain-containing protein n=1 Tax=uncultured Brevundimonas sp. TaxID=213418 RepID=UPI0030EEAED5